MAKALLGQYVRGDDRLAVEAARLRQRVQDLQHVVRSLQEDNDTLRAELETRRLTDQLALDLHSALDLPRPLDEPSIALADGGRRELVEADSSR